MSPTPRPVRCEICRAPVIGGCDCGRGRDRVEQTDETETDPQPTEE